MSIQYIINNSVCFIPDENSLISAKNEEPIKLYAPVANILLILIQRKPTIVSQDELINQAWGEKSAYVLPNTLYQNISLLRKGLKAAGLKEDIIKTIPRQGIQLQPTTIIEKVDNINHLPINKIADEPGKIDRSHQEKIERRTDKSITKIILLLILLISILAFSTKHFWLEESSQNLFFDNYHPVYKANGCAYFAKSNTIKMQYQQILKKIESEAKNCSDGDNYYLTISDINDYWSWVKCNTENTQCEVIHYTGRLNEK
ncbi:winged helix-turn-helix domain-containing protein [Hafnia paralvei]|uniref:winged helix-turn-helix domain-containing protein n=1 Tax=Hafnia paralvei TaxID=546367 RepID=UPI00163C7358|nr:winged helix-turn-helix domain-containing protein [Hafnia paralvei]